MSKRHTASRRRAYGRRQHELHERMERRADRVRGDRTWRGADDETFGTLGYLDSPTGGQPFGFVD